MFLKLFSSALEAVVHINLMISLFRATPRDGEGDEEEEEEEEDEVGMALWLQCGQGADPEL